jgi:hypothetical protein
MSNNDPGLPLEDGAKSCADTSKSAWERPVLRRLAANKAQNHPSAGPFTEIGKNSS